MEDRFILPRLADTALNETAVFADEGSPFYGQVYPGDARMLVIVGENASGKSLLFRMLAELAHRENLLGITISIRERTDSSVPFRRMFMFGDETEQSTGANSVRVVQAGFKNVGGEKPGFLMLDEPEIGLSDGYARAFGQMIGRTTAQELPEGCHGVVVVSHSRRLVEGLAEGLGAIPTFVHMSDLPLDYGRWLTSQDERSIEELLRLGDLSLERRRATSAVINAAKKDKR